MYYARFAYWEWNWPPQAGKTLLDVVHLLCLSGNELLSQCHTCYESKFDLAKEIVALLMMSVGFSGNAIGFPRLAIHFVIMHVLHTGNGIGLPRMTRHLSM